MAIERVKHTVEVSSDIGRRCEHCDQSVGYETSGTDLSKSINHYIEAHGYRLLHVGTRTTTGSDGHPWNVTVAILGLEAAAQPADGVLGEWVG
jgi:hypothetical protein